MWKWAVVVVMLAHGAAHVVGVIGSLLGRELEGTSGEVTIPVGSLERAFAVLWLVALVAFVAAALGLIFGQSWWHPLAAVAAIVSMIPVAIWWTDAWRGAIFNGIVLAVVVFANRIPGLMPE